MGAEVADLFGAVETKPRYTEADIIERLRQRYNKTYANGAHSTLRYVGASHVRFGPLWPSCIADFLVQDTWGNIGPHRHPILGFEIKVSRSDYLREIRDLGKSEPFRRICTEWYMVVSEPTIVRDDLPDGWGLMVANGAGLRCLRKSALNAEPEPMPRGLVAGFLRAVATQHAAAPVPVAAPDEEGTGR